MIEVGGKDKQVAIQNCMRNHKFACYVLHSLLFEFDAFKCNWHIGLQSNNLLFNFILKCFRFELKCFVCGYSIIVGCLATRVHSAYKNTHVHTWSNVNSWPCFRFRMNHLTWNSLNIGMSFLKKKSCHCFWSVPCCYSLTRHMFYTYHFRKKLKRTFPTLMKILLVLKHKKDI
jgi:hypothetical protein